MRIAGLGLPELLIILLVVLLVFGASRLPGVGSALPWARAFDRSKR